MTHLTLQLAQKLVPNTKEHSVKPRYGRWSEASSVRYVWRWFTCCPQFTNVKEPPTYLKQTGPEALTELMFMLLIKSAVKVCSKGLPDLGHTFEQPACCELAVSHDPQQWPCKHITMWGTGNPHDSEQWWRGTDLPWCTDLLSRTHCILLLVTLLNHSRCVSEDFIKGLSEMAGLPQTIDELHIRIAVVASIKIGQTGHYLHYVRIPHRIMWNWKLHGTENLM